MCIFIIWSDLFTGQHVVSRELQLKYTSWLVLLGLTAIQSISGRLKEERKDRREKNVQTIPIRHTASAVCNPWH